jgi:predicted nucleic acid-binding protein
MQKIIVSDTSCLILLQKLHQLKLLKELFGKIIITKEVEDEFIGDLPDFFQIQHPKDPNYHKILRTFLD